MRSISYPPQNRDVPRTPLIFAHSIDQLLPSPIAREYPGADYWIMDLGCGRGWALGYYWWDKAATGVMVDKGMQSEWRI